MVCREPLRLDRAFRVHALLAWAVFPISAAAQDDGSLNDVRRGQPYYYTGAVPVSSEQDPTAAVPAVCPAANPVSCSSISEVDYCCPANNICQWVDSVVACCPSGETCTGNVNGGSEGGWVASTTEWQPTSTYWPVETTVVETPAQTTVYEPQTTVEKGEYCSTLVEIGPGLPTTEGGECGTILVVEADAVQQAVLGWTQTVLMMAGLHALGAIVLWRR